MKTLHIERVYAYGDNEHYYVEVPDDFTVYKHHYLSDKQNHYTYFGDYDEELFNKFNDDIIGVYCYHVEDKMVICFYNNPMGCVIHDFDNIIDNDAELAEKMKDFFKDMYFYEKYDASKDDPHMIDCIDKFFNSADESQEYRDNLLEEIKRRQKIVTSKMIKVLNFDGYYLKYVRYIVYDLMGNPCNALMIDKENIDELFSNAVFQPEDKMYHERFVQLDFSRDASIFNAHYNVLKDIIELK